MLTVGILLLTSHHMMAWQLQMDALLLELFCTWSTGVRQQIGIQVNDPTPRLLAATPVISQHFLLTSFLTRTIRARQRKSLSIVFLINAGSRVSTPFLLPSPMFLSLMSFRTSCALKISHKSSSPETSARSCQRHGAAASAIGSYA